MPVLCLDGVPAADSSRQYVRFCILPAADKVAAPLGIPIDSLPCDLNLVYEGVGFPAVAVQGVRQNEVAIQVCGQEVPTQTWQGKRHMLPGYGTRSY